MDNDLILKMNENSKKFIAVLNKKFEVWRLFNALGHATAWLISLNKDIEEFGFLDYKDGDDKSHPAISHYGFIILKADNSNQILRLRQTCQEQSILSNDFTTSMTIWTSIEQYNQTRQIKEQDLEYLCIVMFGDSDKISPFTKKFSLFK